MSYYTDERSKRLEREIRDYLTKKRIQDSESYTVLTLILFEYITHDVVGKIVNGRTVPEYSELPTGAFNKIIGDMKKAGVIGTAKGGEVVFLSNAAWGLYQAKQAAQAAQVVNS